VDLSWFPDGPAVSGHGTTDANGDITFTYDAALLGISMDAVPFNLLSTYVYCIDNATNEQINADGTKDLTGILFKANSSLSTDVTCDWYLIPPASGPAPTATTAPVNPEPTATTAPVSGLPNTGSGPTSGYSGSPWGLLFVAFACAGLGLSLLKIRTVRR
ncbi:MAG TPA: hypothetical protein PK819_00450, partial [Thermomicrobiales bacterium]|nr:hypothetical protein [Thermomicrobiales bacterium]